MPLVEVGPIYSPSPAYQIFEYEDEVTGQSVFRVLGATAVWLGQFATAAEAVAFVEQRMPDENRGVPRRVFLRQVGDYTLVEVSDVAANGEVLRAWIEVRCPNEGTKRCDSVDEAEAFIREELAQPRSRPLI